MDKDTRFSHIATDPKFRRMPKNVRKVKIDRRFQSMFNDEQFKVKYTVDKRGRPFNHTSSEDLKRYYELSSEESSDDLDKNENEETGKYVRAPKEIESDNTNKEIQLPHVSNKIKRKLKNLGVDYARGEATLCSESSSDEGESESESSETEGIDHAWGDLDRDAERTDEISNRLAACNMDWDRITATDLMVLLSSFLPSGGLINSVGIYPSEYGLQRLQEEECKGPIELVEPIENETVADNSDNEEGSRYNMEKLRQYQLNRLKYYYAVIVCNSTNTANTIYTACDGLEYESSAVKIDLRFISNDTVFDQEPKEICDKMPEPGKYKPRFFTTTALQQAKVDLTWDETNPERLEITTKLAKGNVDDVTEADVQAYLASSSEESEAETDVKDINKQSNLDPLSHGGTENLIDKYRALLNDIENQEKNKDNKDFQMEISWGIDIKEKTEKIAKNKLLQSEDRTPFQQYLDKRKEKRKAKRNELKSKAASSGNESESDIPSDIDMNDPYFAEEFDKPEFKSEKSNEERKRKLDTKKGVDQKQAELELLLLDENYAEKHFSLKKIQNSEKQTKSQKNKVTEEDIFEVDVQDNRFSALYSSHHYNIDPTDPRFKKTKGMEALINEKLKRSSVRNEDMEIKKKKVDTKKNIELNVLIKSVKRKSEAMLKKK